MDIYRSDRGRTAVRAWCTAELDRRLPEACRRVVDSPLGPTHLTTSGTGPQDVLLLPGTNMNAATSVPAIQALAGSCRVTVADLPGQPGLSPGDRPHDDLIDGYRAWLDHVLSTVGVGRPVILVGESRGAAVALCASPGSQVGGLLLVAPAGLTDARISPGLLRVALPWLLRPTPPRSARMLAAMYGEEVVTDHDQLVEWMTLVARHTRSSLSPSPLPTSVVTGWLQTPCHVLVGEHDQFFPPRRVRPAAAGLLHVETTIVPGGGHVLSHTNPEAVAGAASTLLGSVRGQPVRSRPPPKPAANSRRAGEQGRITRYEN